jgi:hypothetical protein
MIRDSGSICGVKMKEQREDTLCLKDKYMEANPRLIYEEEVGKFHPILCRTATT